MAPETVNVVVGEDFLWVYLKTPPDKPTLSRERAVDLAKTHLAGTGQITGVIARYVALTLKSNNGKVTSGIQDRTVWLITFQGFTYEPPGSPQANRGCGGYYIRPNTTVAVDGRDGGLVVEYGEG